jgi:autotransporter-associated beta strand protein
MKLSISAHRLPILAAALISLIGTAHSATITKANNTDALNLATSWLGGTLPGNTNIALWDSTVTASNTVSLGADLALQGISLIDPAGPVTLNTGNTLTLGTSGINLSAATQDLTLQPNLTLAPGGQIWNIPTGRTLTLNTGTFTRSATTALSIQGTGTVAASLTGIANTNNILGPWATTGTGTDTRYATLTAGNIVPFTTATPAAAFGWPSGNNNTFNYDIAATQGNLGIGRQGNTARYTGAAATQNWGNNNTTTVTLNGLLNAGTGTVTFSEAGGVNQGQLAIGTNNANQLVLSAAAADIAIRIPIINTGTNAGSLLVTGPQTVTIDSFGGVSTYTGATTIASGTLALTGGGNINTSTALNINGPSAKYLHTSTVASTVPITLTRGTLEANGTLAAVTVADQPGNLIAHTTSGTANLASLTFLGDASINATITTPAAPIIIASTLTTTPANGTVTLNVNAAPLANGLHPVLNFGTLSGSPADFSLNLQSGINSRQNATLVTDGNNLALQVTGDFPKWTGAVDGNWTLSPIPSPKNWKLSLGGSSTDFLALDNALFDDTATGTTTVTIDDDDISAGVVEFNNSSKNYTLTSNTNRGLITGTIIKNGSGTLTVAAPNLHPGGITFNGGTLNFNDPLAAGIGSLTIGTGSAKTLSNTSGFPVTTSGTAPQTWNDDFTFDSAEPIDFNTGTVTLGGADLDRTLTITSATLTVGELKSTTHGLIKNGPGTLVLSSVGAGADGSSLAGFLEVNDGTLQINRSGSLAANSGDLVALSLFGTGTIVNGSDAERWLFINTSGSNLFEGTLANGGSGGLGFNKQGPGLVTLDGTLSYTGATTVTAGILEILSENTGPGTNATINSGSLTLGHPTALGTASTIRLAGNAVSTLNLASDTPVTSYGLVFGTTTNSTILSNRATPGEGINHTLSTIGINGVGGGTLTIAAGNNVTSGTATITLPSFGLSAGTIQTTALNPTTASVTVGNVSKVANAPAQTLELGGTSTGNSITGVISDGTAPISLVKSNNSTWTLSSTNTYTGNTTIGTANSAGILHVTATGALGSGTINFDASGGTPGPSSRLELSGDITLSNPITLFQRNNPSANILNTGGDNTLTGPINLNVGGAQATLQSDAGPLTLTGPITTGTATPRTLVLTGSANGTISGALSNNTTDPAGTLSLNKNGTGTWFLTATNTHTGNINVNAGTLALTADSPAATGTITVATDATLAGNGDLGGSIIIQPNGKLQLDVAADPGTQATRDIAGTLDLSALGDVLALTAATIPADGTYTLLTATGGITGHTTGTLDDTVLQLTGLTGSVSVVGNSLVLTVGAGGPSAYDAWASDFGLNPLTTGAPSADPDSDGHNNATEFLLGGSPVSGQSGPRIHSLIADSSHDLDSLPELILTIAVPQGTPAFTAGSPTSTATVEGILATVRGSSDLQTFGLTVNPVTPIATGLPAAPVLGGITYEYRSFSLGGSNETPDRGFLQVLITQP